MDSKTAAKQYAGLTQELAATYAVIMGLMLRLPVPVRLPVLADDPDWAVHSMSRTWEVLDWEPLAKLEVGRLRDMITSWITAYELAVTMKVIGVAVWRVRGMEAALLRVRSCARYIDGHLMEYGR